MFLSFVSFLFLFRFCFSFSFCLIVNFCFCFFSGKFRWVLAQQIKLLLSKTKLTTFFTSLLPSLSRCLTFSFFLISFFLYAFPLSYFSSSSFLSPPFFSLFFPFSYFHSHFHFLIFSLSFHFFNFSFSFLFSFSFQFFLLLFFFICFFFSSFLFISLSSWSSSLHLTQLCDFCGLLLISYDTCVSFCTNCDHIWFIFFYLFYIVCILISCGEDSRYAVMHQVLTFCGVQLCCNKIFKIENWNGLFFTCNFFLFEEWFKNLKKILTD